MHPAAPYPPGTVVSRGAGYPPNGWGRGASATVGVGRDDLVSGEAVALDLPAAALGLRIVSGIIDIIVTVVLFIVLVYLSLRLTLGIDTALLEACLTSSAVLAVAVLPTAIETVTRGKTLGHWITGLRTVRVDAGPIRFRHALTRALIGFVEIYCLLGVPALVSAAISRKNQRCGDLVAGTYVIGDRFRLVLPQPAAMPPHLAEWAAAADIGALPDHIGVALREFLIRRDYYHPALRHAQAERLIFALAPFVAPAPPPGSAHEDVLAAIAAQRRHRDSIRLAREDHLRSRLLR